MINKYLRNLSKDITEEISVFTNDILSVKNAVFWDVTPCGFCEK
jgi:hypothetical protein